MQTSRPIALARGTRLALAALVAVLVAALVVFFDRRAPFGERTISLARHVSEAQNIADTELYLRSDFAVRVGDRTFAETPMRLGATIDTATPCGPQEAGVSKVDCLTVNETTLRSAVHAWKSLMDRPSREPRCPSACADRTPGAMGRSLDPESGENAVRAALKSRAPGVTIVLAKVPPRVDPELAKEVSTDAILGFYEVRVEPGDVALVTRLASALTGAVVLPEDSFDLRAHATDSAASELLASTSTRGRSGRARGAFAGALYASALLAGLPILERSSPKVVSLNVAPGFDAELSHDGATLTFRNNYPFPIVLRTALRGSILRAEFRGARSIGSVTVARRVDDVLPFVEREVRDSSLPEGARQLSVRGTPGLRLTMQRTVVRAAAAERTEWKESRLPQEQVWHVGTGPRRAHRFVAFDALDAEVRVDRYFALTTNPDPAAFSKKNPFESGLFVTRVPGPLSVSGYSVRLGWSKSVWGSGVRLCPGSLGDRC